MGNFTPNTNYEGTFTFNNADKTIKIPASAPSADIVFTKNIKIRLNVAAATISNTSTYIKTVTVAGYFIDGNSLNPSGTMSNYSLEKSVCYLHSTLSNNTYACYLTLNTQNKKLPANKQITVKFKHTINSDYTHPSGYSPAGLLLKCGTGNNFYSYFVNSGTYQVYSASGNSIKLQNGNNGTYQIVNSGSTFRIEYESVSGHYVRTPGGQQWVSGYTICRTYVNGTNQQSLTSNGNYTTNVYAQYSSGDGVYVIKQ